MTRRRLATRLGLSGAALGMVAGLVQALAGYGIPEWTGNKLATGALGLLTLALSALAGLAALRQRDPDLSVLSRALCALGLIAPGLLCLTTVGRLWYVPAILLTTAGLLTIENWRATAAALRQDWTRVLLTVLGLCQLLMVASGPVLLMVVGALSAVALATAAWRRSASRRTVYSLVALGTIPFAALGWTAVVPILLAVIAASVAPHNSGALTNSES
ncbi:hypothetical protein [Kribbella jiaozuonensis]|uniref:Uncharacterized protein n=1 Tax=Kribbella jiaozuonensis TaxID=2575441 RepID=A0A4U3LMS3_9ACTN|nr:hypothetical protein [Kribbella jiaozuonensis]TKK75557.1 hypothetical protein FDA38_34775 [Kribbella jiaozuonensis]